NSQKALWHRPCFRQPAKKGLATAGRSTVSVGKWSQEKWIEGSKAMLATANISFETSNTTDFARGNLALADRPQKTSRRSRKAPAAGQVCLVVSPDPLRHMMFGQAAERAGWRQAVASDQTTALAQLASGKVGLVLIDTATPGEHSMAERHLLIELLSG